MGGGGMEKGWGGGREGRWERERRNREEGSSLHSVCSELTNARPVASLKETFNATVTRKKSYRKDPIKTIGTPLTALPLSIGGAVAAHSACRVT
jgi:hypothetical protein